MKLRYLKSFLRDLEKLKDKKTKQQIKAHIEQIKRAEKRNEIRQLKKLSGIHMPIVSSLEIIGWDYL